MTIGRDVDEKIIHWLIDWAQHEFDVCSVIRVEEISWRLWRELSNAGLDYSESEVESVARAIIKQLEPPGIIVEGYSSQGEWLDHSGLVCKAYTDAMHKYVVDAVYVGLSLPPYQAVDRKALPKPDLFLFTQDEGRIWIECERLAGPMSAQVSVMFKKLHIAEQYTEGYDRFIFALPRESPYKRADLQSLINAKTAEELRISFVYL